MRKEHNMRLWRCRRISLQRADGGRRRWSRRPAQRLTSEATHETCANHLFSVAMLQPSASVTRQTKCGGLSTAKQWTTIVCHAGVSSSALANDVNG